MTSQTKLDLSGRAGAAVADLKGAFDECLKGPAGKVRPHPQNCAHDFRPVDGQDYKLCSRCGYASAVNLSRQPHTSSTGPATSQDAGDAHTDSGKRQTNAMRVLGMLYDWRAFPRTASGLHTISQMGDGDGVVRPPLTLTEVRRRLTDLQALDYVEKGERRGREFTWKITPAGLFVLQAAWPGLARR